MIYFAIPSSFPKVDEKSKNATSTYYLRSVELFCVDCSQEK